MKENVSESLQSLKAREIFLEAKAKGLRTVRIFIPAQYNIALHGNITSESLTSVLKRSRVLYIDARHDSREIETMLKLKGAKARFV